MTKNCCRCVVVATLLFGRVACAVDTEREVWSRFRGPNGTGISNATTVPKNWTDDDYRWQIQLPGVGHSSPVVWGEQVYVTAADPATADRFVRCVNADSGDLVWERKFQSQPHGQHGASSYADATPAVDADGIVLLWASPDQSSVVAISAEGEEQWRRDLGPFVGANGSGVSPIIVGDLVVVANDQDDVRYLTRLMGKENPQAPVGVSSIVALDRRDGAIRWQLERQTILASYATPCVRTTSTGEHELILISTARGVSGVDVATGQVKWEITELFPERCVASPILADDLVIASYGRGINGELCVAARAGMNGVGDESTLAYEIKRSVPLVPTPVYHNGLLFLWVDNGVVACVKGATGEQVWRERVGGNFYGSPVCVDDHLYCIARNGDVVVLAATAKFQKVARVALGEDSNATPAVANGIMYLRTKTRLFALGGT